MELAIITLTPTLIDHAALTALTGGAAGYAAKAWDNPNSTAFVPVKALLRIYNPNAADLCPQVAIGSAEITLDSVASGNILSSQGGSQGGLNIIAPTAFPTPAGVVSIQLDSILQNSVDNNDSAIVPVGGSLWLGLMEIESADNGQSYGVDLLGYYLDA